MTTSLTGSRPDPGPRGSLALRIAAAVDAVPGCRRWSGAGVRIATQFRGGSVDGVRLGADEIGVHVVAEQLDVLRLADAVSEAVTAALDATERTRRVIVSIDDLDVEGLDPWAGPGSSGGGR